MIYVPARYDSSATNRAEHTLTKVSHLLSGVCCLCLNPLPFYNIHFKLNFFFFTYLRFQVMPISGAHICFLALLLLHSLYSQSQVKNEGKNTSASRISLMVNNYGTFGRPTVRSNTSGPSSMAYPKGSGVEHLFEAGIWIGAFVDGQPRVSTSSIEASAGYAQGGSGFEFTPTSSIKERSKLTGSSAYSANAVSHQDFVIDMTDSFTYVPSTSQPIMGHNNPLKASVRLETYNWNYSYADFFVICNYEITNNSDKRWDSVYVGNFADMVVKNIFVQTEGTGTNFFNKGRNSVDDTYHAIYAYLSAKSATDFNDVSSYGAMQFLGMDWRNKFFNPGYPEIFTDSGYSPPKVNYNFWVFGSVTPPFYRPDDEGTRFSKLAVGADSADLYSISGPVNGPPSNWIQLMSAGPLRSVEPGEKFTYTMAWVCARQLKEFCIDQGTAILSTPESRAELTEHLKRCRATYLGEDTEGTGKYTAEKDINTNGKLDRYVLPEPPATPHTKVVSSDKKIEIYWSNNSEYSVDPITRLRDFEGYRIYLSKPGDDLKPNFTDQRNLIAQWDSAGNDIGYNNGFAGIKLASPIKFDGDTTTYHYNYTIDNLNNGWQYLLVITSFDEGNKVLDLESLESSYSENEYRVFSGSAPNDFKSEEQSTKVGVYPNPYNVSAAWDGGTSRTRKIYFYNLPNRCEITIYTVNGDMVATLLHDGHNYTGQGSKWFDVLGDQSRTVMSGGEHAWDILSNTKSEVSQGIYVYSVKDLQSGLVQSGSFAIIK